MKTYVVQGPTPLKGDVPISGAKNATLKLMAAALMVPGEVVLERVPRISDVSLMCEVLERLGVEVAFEGSTLRIDATNEPKNEATYELVSKIRASIQVLGPLLARLGSARVSMPGGDAIGSRPIDLHLRGLERMGAEFSSEHGYVEGVAARLTGARVLLEFPSVGATETLLMAGTTAEGTTTIDNAAREPEIQDLAQFLNEAGARVLGAGTNTITIEGVAKLHPARHVVLPDRIEAGTYAIGAAATGGDVTLRDIRPGDMELVLQKLEDSGAEVTRETDSVRIRATGRPAPMDLVTLPYPGFPTDLQPPMMVLLAQATGPSILTENVFEARFIFVDELNRMGAQVRVEGHHAVIKGVERLTGAPVRAPDIRAGAALMLGGLSAHGETRIHDEGHIERGYEDFVAKLEGLGAVVSVTEG
ncbi:MAG: UDP-N-acetylglucosamine 1-carboxyvinyltransferase [Actinobacteria bacterium]|nr:UDP-N-acetylglucosamine 1-carboxyvinyltransferase [Actinomycetota bacterium]